MGEYLFERVMVAKMNLEIGLELHVLHKVLKLCFTELLIHGDLLSPFIEDLLMFVFDDFSEDIDEIKDTNFKKNIEKMVIAFKTCKYKVLIQVVIKGFLFYCFLI